MSETPSEPCLFCRFVSREITPDVVTESEHSLAFRDINPQAPTHILVVPKRHVANVAELAKAAPEELADLVVLGRAAARHDGHLDGYRIVANTGADAGQSVFHAHLHVLAGRPLEWPPG